MVHVTCTALHCPSSSRTTDIKFHQLPHDTKRRNIWLKACKRFDVINEDSSFFKHKYLCSLHFPNCMYTSKDYLRKTAVPSLHLSAKAMQHDSSTQTDEFKQYQNMEEQTYQNNLSILNVEKSCTPYTQSEDSLPYKIHDVDVKEEPDFFELDVETEIDNNDDADYGDRLDLDTSEEDEDIKPDIGETEILPQVQSTQFLQSRDFLRYNIHNVDVKKEIITKTHTEESQPFKADVEIKTENDDGVDINGDLESSGEDVEIKPDIGEIEVLPLTPGLHSVDFQIMKDKSKKPLRKIDEDKTATIASRIKGTIRANFINASVQTDRVMVLNPNPDGSVSVNTENCTCEDNYHFQMTRAQFYSSCSKFLSPSFCEIVRKQVHLDRFKKHVENELNGVGKSSSEAAFDILEESASDDSNDGIEKSTADLDVDNAAERREMVSADFVMADTKIAENDLLVEVKARVAVSEADYTQSTSEGPSSKKRRI